MEGGVVPNLIHLEERGARRGGSWNPGPRARGPGHGPEAHAVEERASLPPFGRQDARGRSAEVRGVRGVRQGEGLTGGAAFSLLAPSLPCSHVPLLPRVTSKLLVSILPPLSALLARLSGLGALLGVTLHVVVGDSQDVPSVQPPQERVGPVHDLSPRWVSWPQPHWGLTRHPL